MGDTIVEPFTTTVASPALFGTGPGAGLFVTCLDGPSNTYFTHNQGIPSGSAYADFSVGGTDMVTNVASASGFAMTAIGSNADLLDNGFGTVRYTDVVGQSPFHGFLPNGVNRFFPDCWDSDGFWTVDQGSSSSTAASIILGNQVHAKVAKWFPNQTTGNQSVTGVGFQPDMVIFIGCISGIHDTGSSQDAFGSAVSYGVMDSSGNQWAVSCRSAFESGEFAVGGILDAVTRYRVFHDNACVVHIGAPQNFSANTVDTIAHYVSMDADGFTVDLTAAGADSGGNGQVSWYLALKAIGTDAKFACGTGTQGDSTISVGWAPDAMMFGSVGTPNNTIDTVYGGISIGMTDGAQQYNGWLGGVTSPSGNPGAQGEWWGISYFSELSCMRWAKLSNLFPFAPLSSVTLVAEATAALTGTGANLSWSTDDGSANKFGWIAFQTQNSTINYAPIVVTGNAVGISATSATLNGTIIPQQPVPVFYAFDWGNTTAYGNRTTITSDGSGFTLDAVSATITGLTRGAIYHYRLCAYKTNAITCPECDGDRQIILGSQVVFRNRFRAEQ